VHSSGTPAENGPRPSIVVTPAQFLVVLRGRLDALERERALVTDLLLVYEGS